MTNSPAVHRYSPALSPPEGYITQHPFFEGRRLTFGLSGLVQVTLWGKAVAAVGSKAQQRRDD